MAPGFASRVYCGRSMQVQDVRRRLARAFGVGSFPMLEQGAAARAGDAEAIRLELVRDAQAHGAILGPGAGLDLEVSAALAFAPILARHDSSPSRTEWWLSHGGFYTSRLWLLIAEFGLATLGYAACATIFLTLPSDMFESGSVATVSGLAGMVTGFVTIVATYAVGTVTDKYSFTPILLAASAAPVLAAIAVLTLVRNTRNTGNGTLLKI
jgi:hypothetical protein